MKINDFTVRIGGQAGDGSLATGELLSRYLRRAGYYVATDKDFPSRIRGGHTSYAIRGSEKKIYSIHDKIDALLAFDDDSLKLHLNEIETGGALIYDSSRAKISIDRKDIRIIGLPFTIKAKNELGNEIIKNTMSLGILTKIFGLDIELMKETISDTYKKRGEKILKDNLRAYEIGLELSKDENRLENYSIQKLKRDENKLLMMGNEAIALGAMAAGCKFIAAYPITPASDVLEFMSKYLPKNGGVAIQAESEISAINMAIGAAYAGIRSMVATSGPGFDLKTEAIGLASMIEQPVVILDAMRAGPSTGMPTKTEQSDINHAVYGGHGDKPKVVIVPGNVEEAFYMTFEAFNIAEVFQGPVIILTDELISWNKQVVNKFNIDSLKINRGKLLLNIESNEREFKRYEFSEDGISRRTIPGVKNGVHLETGDEHDEYGHITENPEIRNKMMEKRNKKMEYIKNMLFKSEIIGDGENVIVSIGSTLGPILEAMEMLKKDGIETTFVRIRTLLPFLEDPIETIDNAKRVFVVENNITGQLENLLKIYVNRKDFIPIRKYDGRSFRPGFIYNKIKEVF
ncbi:MAG: 2-oxoacid:acceptor oxidoreductase subunit alpha [Thermoplasmata archaeon]|jgi:2-oxoglutarate ferredoxin oxidoreductase subunit alpha